MIKAVVAILGTPAVLLGLRVAYARYQLQRLRERRREGEQQ